MAQGSKRAGAFAWPEGARIAVVVTCLLENWSDGKGPNPSDWFISPNPYARTGPGVALDGKPKFDLEKWDDAYFERLRARVREAGDRGIYVSVMLFQGWSSAKSWLGGTPWRGHPYHPKGLRSNNLYKLIFARLSGFAMKGHA